MSVRKMVPELLGMALYVTGKGEYFYAWSANNAIKKKPNTKIYIVTDYGKKVHVGGTETI